MGSHALGHDRVMYGILAILVAANTLLGLVLATSRIGGILLALVPIGLVAIGRLIASTRVVLVYIALIMMLAAPLPLSDPFTLGTAIVYPSDIIVLLAVGSWAVARLAGRPERARRVRNTRLISWSLTLFALALAAALIHGHIRYGAKIVGPPLRLVAYAGIALAFSDIDARGLYRGIVAIFYVGTVWQTGVAIYDLATGTASTAAVDLSTGGARVLAGSTAMLMAASFLLALLNLERDRRAARTALHVVIALLATFTLVVTFQRTTFALVALLVPLLLLVFRTVTARAASFLPLVAPFVALAVLLIPRADPHLLPTLRDRLFTNLTTDTSVSWRAHATHAVWMQVKDAPIVGVGFGRQSSFTLNGIRTNVGQDPHNQYLYLWAAGGLLLLGTFVLLLLNYATACWRRFRLATKDGRRLIFWAASVWFVFVVNSATGIVLTSPPLLLIFWVLMVTPMVVLVKEPPAAPLV